ncbi:hypothetical protein CCMSSC00406_0010417 [Pleurotus cornucopiae]|uniref:Uncharacterized protein n=1 Tax=Pleurotus cornucopiae TaxID=5321 RepID=A0ACB7IIQ8_PLECO|nr:hypothetical protein CCMSSC00406_0010417 [Pleurotus cornucopiae]
MSLSPPIRRLSSASSSSRQEDLINAYEAEEERIINILSRKLEQASFIIGLENALEAESESHVNRLSRELTALRMAQQQQPQQQSGMANGSVSVSPDSRLGYRAFVSPSVVEPNAEIMLEAMRRENEQLRARLVDTERDYIRIARLNEVYREELIDHRRRLGLSVDNLIGLPSPDPLSQPTHHRAVYSPISSASSSPSSVMYVPHSRPTHSVPIPRPTSQVHRPVVMPSGGNTPLSHSPSSDGPFLFSPAVSTNPASFLSNDTHATTPPSSGSLLSNPPVAFGSVSRTLSYPSVPPPSLSSSFGSPSVSFHIPHRDPSISPIEPLSRRNSNARRGSLDRRVVETGSLRTMSRSGSRRGSVERGARIAETGTLLPRSRASSQSLSTTNEVPDAAVGINKPSTPHGYAQWELEQPQQHQQFQQQPQQAEIVPSPVPSFQSNTTIQLEEVPPERIVPSQTSEAQHVTRLRPTHAGHEHRSEASGSAKPRMQVDTSRPSLSPAGSSLALRHSPVATRPPVQYHPYRRPQSAAGPSPVVAAPSRHRHEPEQSQHVRFIQHPPASTVPSPSSAPSRLTSFGHVPSPPPAAASSPTILAAVPPITRARPEPTTRHFNIRADVQYDPDTKMLTAMLELPGSKRTDLSVRLSTCVWNRVKQVTVSGKSKPGFPEGSLAVRERRFGQFSRTFAVGAETKRDTNFVILLSPREQPEDISADLEDGVLTLRIACGTPSESEDSHEITIR